MWRGLIGLRLATWRLTTRHLVDTRGSLGKIFPHNLSKSLDQRLNVSGFVVDLGGDSRLLKNTHGLFGASGISSISELTSFEYRCGEVTLPCMQSKVLCHFRMEQPIFKSSLEV